MSRWMDTQKFKDNTRVDNSMRVTFFHWGIHWWIPYVVVCVLISSWS